MLGPGRDSNLNTDFPNLGTSRVAVAGGRPTIAAARSRSTVFAMRHRYANTRFFGPTPVTTLNVSSIGSPVLHG